jgi:hypothetical protein
MSNQDSYEVMLSGNGVDLRNIQGRGSSNYFRLFGGIDHHLDCPTDFYNFNSIYFKSEDDLDTVWQVSYELVSLLNGAFELFEYRHHPLSIHGILIEGVQQQYFDRREALAMLLRPEISEYRYRQEVNNAFKADIRLGCLVLATENEDIYMILKYMSRESSWGNYYKLMETVDSHCAIKKLKLDDDSVERKRFTMTANNYSMAGFDSRHGFIRQLKENKQPPMSIEEGYRYVAGMCAKYLNAAYGGSANVS